MADEKMQSENKKSLNTREDNVAEDIRREAAGKDAEMAADKTGRSKEEKSCICSSPTEFKEQQQTAGKTSGTGTSGTEPGSSKR